MVADREHVERIAGRLRTMGAGELFLIGGDQWPPLGRYASARELVNDLAPLVPGVRIGVAGYPEGHPSISDRRLLDELASKQDLASAIVTQICFDPAAIAGWLRSIRVAGITLPVLVGVPGVVDRRRLLELSARVGVGASTRYLRKNLRLATRLVARASFEPGALVDALAAIDPSLGIQGLHLFTFNQVAATAAWRRARLTEEIVDV
jgi:methylenetetrahydrofolate reductase (NADPH)